MPAGAGMTNSYFGPGTLGVLSMWKVVSCTDTKYTPRLFEQQRYQLAHIGHRVDAP